MTPRQNDLVSAVEARCGTKAVITDPLEIEPWTIDWRGRYRGASPAILAPASTGEVAAIVGLARHHDVALVPQGGNTSMVGGATPPADGSALILSLRRMNRVRSIDPAAGLAIAEAGVILSDLHTAVLASGRRFPLTLGARGSCTIGGLTATNAGGTQVLRFGTMRALVAGVEAVLADGSVHNGLPALKKDNRGYDINHLLIGSEGTLAVITAVSLRLTLPVLARGVAWVGVASPQAALDLLRTLESQSDAIESFELIAADTLALAVAHIPGVRSPLAQPQPWNVLIEAVATDRRTETPVEFLERSLAAGYEAGLIADAMIAANEAQADALWRIRDSLSEAERAAGPATQHDISVPIDDLPRFLIETGAAIEARFPGVEASAFGHLGDGNLHYHVRAAARHGPGWGEVDAPAITRLLHDLVADAGGSLSAEHGIGQMKRDELARLGPPSRIATLRAIKYAFDPTNIMNPEKLVTSLDHSIAPR